MSRLGGAKSWRDRQAKIHAYLEPRPEFKILNAIVQQPHESAAQQSLPDAVQQIVDLAPARIPGDDALGDQIYALSLCVLEVVERTDDPMRLRWLVEFLQQLRKVALTDDSGQPVRSCDSLVYTELGGFGPVFADTLGSFDPLDSDILPEDEKAWENLSVFFAQLTGTSTADCTNWSLWSLTAFHYAFVEPRGPGNAVSNLPTPIAVRAACIWFLYAGEVLWSNVQTGFNFGKVPKGEQPDFNREKWNAWRQRLMEYQSRFTDGRTKKFIEDALAEIKRVEGKGH
ncbi:uncharacterized protein K452DRAFT_359018 [Aplosporella prunicola CBS 121167]|uniref:Uncharacterized protein n=1 Tax=Aplosporella prunicola CBS 121167 TaxID=1176127 RepID=A0A6A6BB04_9PEZI|nr:uncharacterized protein K452DRAFT_359018 [Aplosporella prunicola CBS 121167]KAF2141216.1 hypothetical protein K452DRAFT_359018 [Aplosporella prunicola CBS 121167]